ncbi:hypothetical protein RhiJN_26896 [Ceratobasidium sp. AG-Ba]|nr:hypothetical protein RhiJN_12849 [Ceratobasidium sp. AG-Ba]QRV98877.1 hypothetical protein RhiJN_26896 [Ceratobasidium sp. AG-Ba]
MRIEWCRFDFVETPIKEEIPSTRDSISGVDRRLTGALKLDVSYCSGPSKWREDGRRSPKVPLIHTPPSLSRQDQVRLPALVESNGVLLAAPNRLGSALYGGSIEAAASADVFDSRHLRASITVVVAAV